MIIIELFTQLEPTHYVKLNDRIYTCRDVLAAISDMQDTDKDAGIYGNCMKDYELCAPTEIYNTLKTMNLVKHQTGEKQSQLWCMAKDAAPKLEEMRQEIENYIDEQTPDNTGRPLRVYYNQNKLLLEIENELAAWSKCKLELTELRNLVPDTNEHEYVRNYAAIHNSTLPFYGSIPYQTEGMIDLDNIIYDLKEFVTVLHKYTSEQIKATFPKTEYGTFNLSAKPFIYESCYAAWFPNDDAYEKRVLRVIAKDPYTAEVILDRVHPGLKLKRRL